MTIHEPEHTFVEHLFDPSPFTTGTPKTRRSSGYATASLAVEAHLEPWCALRTNGGVAPFFHLPAGMNGYSATVARCGLTGTKIHNLGVDQMIRCPLCQLETEL